MALVTEKKLPGGGCIRVHTDYCPATDEERRAADLAFEMTLAQLISSGQINIPGIGVGDEVSCKLVSKTKEREKLEAFKGNSGGNPKSKACGKALQNKA